MVESMNKYAFLIFHQDYEPFLKQIRDLGVMHIQQSKATEEIESLQSLIAERKDVNDTLEALAQWRDKEAPDFTISEPISSEVGRAKIDEVKSLFTQHTEALQQVDQAERELIAWQLWGEYDVNRLEQLNQSGYPVEFYSVSMQQYKAEWEERYNAVPINDAMNHQLFVTIGNPTGEQPEAEKIAAPTKDLQTLADDVEQARLRVQEVEDALRHQADHQWGDLQGVEQQLANTLSLGSAMEQAMSHADGRLMLLEGWVPTADAEPFEQSVKELPVFVEPLEINEADDVPIKLKNNSFNRLFEPITRMYSLPNYLELDITAFFAPFFMLFFSLCFGDGGYGALVFILSTLFKRKAKDQSMRDAATLGQWLGGTATVVGLLLGTVFGMIMPWAKPEDFIFNQDNMMLISVVLGLVQILLGKTLAAYNVYRQKGIKYALAPFAWVVVIISLGFAILTPQFGWSNIVSKILYALAALAGVVIVFYNSPKKNPFVNIGSAIWDTYNAASGLLGDSLSYIRLFAIGMTSGILGNVFNTLAVDLTKDMPIGVNIFVMVFILLFGHGLNFALAMISSFVHPLRLTLVEFYKNAGFQGGGNGYEPFRLQKQ